jgi:hypothetical protein
MNDIVHQMKNEQLRHATRAELTIKNNILTTVGKNLKGTDHLKDLSADGRIILKWILKKKCSSVGVW